MVSKHFVACKVGDLKVGQRKIVEFGGKSIGVFNVDGQFYALLNYCPHKGGTLCLGPITGTTLPTNEFKYIYAREGSILRCAWHGWEFEIATGQALIDPKIRAKKYHVAIENNNVVVYL
jgi:nitrite reductase/ring-hydroxylating ferredoxin subunit